MSTKKPRDPATLTDADLPTMTEEEQALYYEANAHRLDEIFDGGTQEFTASEDLSVVVSVRVRGDDLRALEAAASSRDMKLSTFIREAALQVARAPKADRLPGDAERMQESFLRILADVDKAARLSGVETLRTSWLLSARSDEVERTHG